ncbi:hypothetical protein K438DRAFT_1970687 [Mycena galopus ATCC 62051]|nr:hypothetical protein K438DRAFT_1970687 [Mycena galopus ATCC 62051]
MATVPYPWPSSQIIDRLVEKSSGYFIYVATVVKFIDDKQFRPVERLDIILGTEDRYAELPFAPLDQVYYHILSSVPMRFPFSLVQILVAIDAQFALRSVILAEDRAQVTVHHASFLDFLGDSSRSGPFYVGSSQCRTNLSLHLLKAFSNKNGDPSFNRLEKLAWGIGGDRFQYISHADPSPELLPGVRTLNPDFIFAFKDQSETVIGLLRSLEKFNPVDKDLVRRWEDYYFMSLCDDAWDPNPEENDQQWNTLCDDVLVQLSPQLLHILYAAKVLPTICDQCCLARIHFLLGISWDDLREAICPLRGLLGDDLEELQDLRTCNFDKVFLAGLDANVVLSELGHRVLPIMVEIINGDTQCRGLQLAVRGWGFFCPASPNLLQTLEEVENSQTDGLHRCEEPEDLHNVVQWLKTCNPSPRLMARYKHLLGNCIKLKSWRGISYSFENLEGRWMEWRDRVKSA